MKVRKIIIHNFKSFEEQEFNLRDVNILVGANSSGKTNLVQVFEFLKGLKKNGIHEAVANLGGFDDLKNFNTTKKSIQIKIELQDGNRKFVKYPEIENRDNHKIYRIRENIFYDIIIMKDKQKKKEEEIDIKEELKFIEYFIETDKNENFVKELSSKFEYSIINTFGNFEIPSNERSVAQHKLSYGIEPKLDITTPFHRTFLTELNQNFRKKSLLEYPGTFIPSNIFDFGIFDFEPKLIKKYITKSYSELLHKSGENLVLIIEQLKKDPDIFEAFLSNVKATLDFVENINSHSIENQTYLTIKECCNKIWIKAKLISDGTASIIALIVALFYQKYSIILIEEPEKGVHPALIASIMEKIYSVTDKQILITTHNPEMLRQSNRDDIYILDKEECSTTIENINNKEMVRSFLEQELGVEELFIDNLLND